MSTVLQELLGITSEEFFKNYWEQDFFKAPGGCAELAPNLFTSTDLEAVLHLAPQTPHPYLSLYRNGKKLDRSSYSGATALNRGRISELVEAGVSILSVWVQDYSQNVLWLVRNLETELSCRVNVNLYKTPRQSRAFDVHHDHHCVLILQLEGCKRWNLYGFDLEKPVEKVTPIGRQLGPIERELRAELVLEAGDVLYVPRGMAHEVFCDEHSASTHLTVGLHPITWLDVLRVGLHEAGREQPALREALMPGVWGPDLLELDQERLCALLDKLKTWIDPDDVGKKLRQSFPQRARGAEDLRLDSDPPAIGPETWLSQSEPCEERLQGGQLILSRPFSRMLLLKPECKPALEFLASAREFQPRQLPGLPEQEQVMLAHHLYRCGYLRLPASVPSA